MLDTLQARLKNLGGNISKERMLHHKENSLKYAFHNSYHNGHLQRIFGARREKPILDGIINSTALSQDVDTKMVSVLRSANFNVGTLFYWRETQTCWIVYLEQVLDQAYFRGYARRCDHVLKWVDKDRNLHETYSSIIGPGTLQISERNSLTTSITIPNEQLIILIPENPLNMSFFAKDQLIAIKGFTYKINVIDNVSTPGIMQMTAVKEEATMDIDIEKNISNAINIGPYIPMADTDYGIEGSTTIKPREKVRYSSYITGGHWIIKGLPEKDFEILFTAQDNTYIDFIYNNVRVRSQFTVQYVTPQLTYEKIVFVASMF